MSLFTVAIPVYFTIEFLELFEATTYIQLRMFNVFMYFILGARGGVVVKALRYKPRFRFPDGVIGIFSVT